LTAVAAVPVTGLCWHSAAGGASDPRITTETYGHLQPDYLRSEIDRLCFGTAPTNDLSSQLQRSAARGHQQLTSSSQDSRSDASPPSEGGDIREEIWFFSLRSG
jgi:hypothetical protein